MSQTFEYLGEHRFHMEVECAGCGAGRFTVQDNSDAPIPVRVPPSIHDDEGRSVMFCPGCDTELEEDGALRVALDYHVTLDATFVQIDRHGNVVDWPHGMTAERAIREAAKIKRMEPDLVVAITVCEAINYPVSA